ncbi:MAG: GGDEF domain-containing protein [Thioalkalispiraceae bacterium]|jgi:diguanylate cyclase (GGDEF)-like protein
MQPVEFKKLNCLVDYCDEVFQHFYRELLSNKVFFKYFANEEQVKTLLAKQQENFLATLQESREDLIKRYYHVGKVHYQHDIPYEVFLSGTNLLRDKFNETIDSRFGKTELSLLNEALFDFIAEAMAKGYMDIFIENEKADLEKILQMTRNVTFGTEKRLLVKHYHWMLDLLTAIDERDYSAIDDLVLQQNGEADTLYSYITEHLTDIEQTIQAEEIERIRFRIVANTENIFFYLRREAYSEVLSLIINILEIYKLTLVLDNVISNIIVKKAESVINEKVKLSETDPLTNIMNRRKFEELLDSLLLRAQRAALPLTIMILDIDDFKQINDQFGHQSGDLVLVEMAELLSKSIRKDDHLLRYGGEEFVIISADSDLDGVRQMAEKIRKDVQQHKFNGIGEITVSIGLAELNKSDDSTSFFSRADQKLYEAKASGKNCLAY